MNDLGFVADAPDVGFVPDKSTESDVGFVPETDYQKPIPTPAKPYDESMDPNAGGAIDYEGEFAKKVNAAKAAQSEPIIPPSAMRKLVDVSNPIGQLIKRLPVPESIKQGSEGVSESLSEGASGMTSGEMLATLPAFAVPVVGEGLAMGLGAKGVGEGLGKLSAAQTPKERGKAIGETALATGMLLPGALKSARDIGLTKSADAVEQLTKGKEPDASTEPIATSLPEHEVRAPVGQATPLRQPGETAEVQAPAEVRPKEEVAKFVKNVDEGTLTSTEDARAFGETIKTPEEIAALKQAYSDSQNKVRAAMEAAGKEGTDPALMDEMARISNQPSIINEAIESATGAYDVKSTDRATYSKLMQEGQPKPQPAKPSEPPIQSIDAIPEGAEKQSAIDGLISKLESARVKGAGVQASIFPGLDAGTARALWNTGIDVMIGVLKATRSVSKSIDAAMEHWKTRHPDFDEASARKALESGLTPQEFGESGSPAYGIAQRVREQRVSEGQVADVPPGKGIAPQESVENGRELLAAGRSPEETLNAFEKSKALSAEDIAVVRAHGEQLARDAETAKKTFGRSSPEYQAAWDRLSEWDRRSKAMQTEWHKIGMAQQGETDIETGTFTGLQRAYKDATGKDFTPGQASTAEVIAEKVTKADGKASAANENLHTHIKKRSLGVDAEKAALDAASKVSREWEIRKAQMETEARVKAQELKTDLEKIERKRQEDVAANLEKEVRARANRKAKEETEARVKRANEEKKAAEAQRKAEQKRADAANLRLRKAAIEKARNATKERVARADEVTYAWNKAREYIDSGLNDFNDIRSKVATDMGISVDKVTALLGRDKRAKFLQDDLWKKQQTARLLKQQAKTWVKNQAIPGYLRALASIPKILFGLKVGFHGTVALGTHAPMVAFQPGFWKTYARDFGKMYKMVGSKTYYEMQVQDLIRRSNYTTARRAGLVNDPFTYEDFNSPDTAKYFGNITGMGNRGYTVLKILRQDMFDQQWNNLPKTSQIKEVAEAIADGVNHATGVVKGKAPTAANLALFAPRLEASRVAWLAVDPVRALKSLADWKNATEGDKVFAINQIKEKAWVAGTLFGLLTLNQGILSAIGSKQKVNFDDPLKSDFLKFKVAGMDFSYGNAMISMARLPVRLYQIRESDGGKLKNLVHPDESSYTVLGEYARSQASPFASLAESLWFKSDWQNRPLPNSNRPVPKRLKAQGVKPYTWPEFWTEQVLPIPMEEAMREVWDQGLGMNDEQIKHMRKAMATISIMAATGGRLVEDKNVKP